MNATAQFIKLRAADNLVLEDEQKGVKAATICTPPAIPETLLGYLSLK
jgi:hypothetical protein